MLIHSMKKLGAKALGKFLQKKIRLTEVGAYQPIYDQIKSDVNILKNEILENLVTVVNHAVKSQSSLAAVYCEIAHFLLNCGQPEAAQVYYKLSLAESLLPSTYSLYLQCLLMSPSCTDKEMYMAATKYNELFLNSIPKYSHYSNELNKNKKLNIGYLCHFFHNSVSQSMLIPFLRKHNREQVKIFCYSDAPSAEVSDDIKIVADVWRETKQLDDMTLATLIREDKIDILLELNGHCVVNRYGVMARKPAPIQISYYNLCATSGISTIDYILVGDAAIIDKSQPFYTESIYYINGVAGIATFPDTFPACAPLPPCLANQYITFGSFGAAHKVNYTVIKLWCKVLKAIPNARFYMKAGMLSHYDYVKAYKKLFDAEGINLERIHLEGVSEHLTMLQYYSKMDIGLDTFPGQGGSTTTEALWQGVPVLTLRGDRYSMQVGPMIMTCIGHSELIAESEEEFIQKAIELAQDQNRLIHYRKQLREDFKHSTLMDAAGFASRLENAYRDMWTRHCVKNR